MCRGPREKGKAERQLDNLTRKLETTLHDFFDNHPEISKDEKDGLRLSLRRILIGVEEIYSDDMKYDGSSTESYANGEQKADDEKNKGEHVERNFNIDRIFREFQIGRASCRERVCHRV